MSAAGTTTTNHVIPEMMHALQVVKLGLAEESLQYNQVKTPKVTSPHDILIEVRAAGVNPVEAKARQGNLPIPFLSTPRIMGSDYSGIVVDKGAKVTEFNIGDAVYGSLLQPIGPNGSYAEYILTSRSYLYGGAIIKKPDNISFEEAAGVGIALVTAYQAIAGSSYNLPKEGTKKILVIGASGGVGTYAIQYAKTIPDTQVIGVCSGKNAKLVRSLGADDVIDYTSKEAMDTLVKDEARTYDMIVDCIGGDDYYYQVISLLKKKGVYSTAVGPSIHFGAQKQGLLDVAKIGMTLLSRKLFGSHSYQITLIPSWKVLEMEVAPLLASGKIKTVLREDQIFDLKDGVQAHKKIESHRTVGKIILRV
ncbi:chaperonin 10-like protein [Phascolomyces articulosus]|uniref:Chaperonin 10-like protein n=1 Tax=Phascolomyces articulosus TaxID=60185 RepID=A0AAD5PD29_9FUNG|nr:chaperonin 10-like protein [Phascolomyces articulosus]